MVEKSKSKKKQKRRKLRAGEAKSKKVRARKVYTPEWLFYSSLDRNMFCEMTQLISFSILCII